MLGRVSWSSDSLDGVWVALVLIPWQSPGWGQGSKESACRFYTHFSRNVLCETEGFSGTLIAQPLPKMSLQVLGMEASVMRKGRCTLGRSSLPASSLTLRYSDIHRGLGTWEDFGV